MFPRVSNPLISRSLDDKCSSLVSVLSTVSQMRRQDHGATLANIVISVTDDLGTVGADTLNGLFLVYMFSVSYCISHLESSDATYKGHRM